MGDQGGIGVQCHEGYTSASKNFADAAADAPEDPDAAARLAG